MSLSGKTGRRRESAGYSSSAVSGKKRSASETAIASARPAEEVQLPFVMEVKRPRKMRFDLCQFNGATAIQVYDGANGWETETFSQPECLWSHIRRTN